jgi:pimeloyl-ACP methyl ester carboxylesterase
MNRHTISVMGRKAAYWERNPYGEPTLLMLHGFRGSHKGLTDISQHFAGFRLIIPDLPGYGESQALEIPHTLEHYARWLDEFVTVLELDGWVSWSHSYSSSIALIQAATGFHKPTAMISVSMAVLRRGLPSAVSTLYYWAGQYMPANMRQQWIASRAVDHATGRWLFMTMPTARRREKQRLAERDLPMLNPQVVTEEYMSALKTNLEPYARDVQVPVLIIAGARDVIVPLKQLEHLAGLLKDGTLVVMQDQGHLAPIERPAATATISKRFINGLGR